jgi:hypothetical protein
VVLTRNEVIGENWFLDVTKDVMHNLGKDLHVNVAGDIFYTGAATYQMKIDKDMSAKIAAISASTSAARRSSSRCPTSSCSRRRASSSLKAGDTGDMLAEAMTIKIKGAMTVAIEASMGVSLKCGGSFVSVGPAGVDISGPLVKINSGGSGASASAALKASPAAPTDAKKRNCSRRPARRGTRTPSRTRCRTTRGGATARCLIPARLLRHECRLVLAGAAARFALGRPSCRVHAVIDGLVVPGIAARLRTADTGGWDCLQRGALSPEAESKAAFLAELKENSPFPTGSSTSPPDLPGLGRAPRLEARPPARA